MSELHRFLDEAQALLPAAVALRRRIHQKPELGLDLPLTTEAVLDGLKGLDVGIARGPDRDIEGRQARSHDPCAVTWTPCRCRKTPGSISRASFKAACTPAGTIPIPQCWFRRCTCCTGTGTSSPAPSSLCSSPARKATAGLG